MEEAVEPADRTGGALAALAGLVLLGGYLALFNHTGFRAEQGRGFVYVGATEGLFWLAHYGLAVPGLLLVSWGLAAPLGRAVLHLAAAAGGRRARLALAATFVLGLFVLAEAGRERLLLGLPITGDEHAVLFGARAVASGRLAVPVPEPREAFPLSFIVVRDGLASSFDFPGGVFFAAMTLVLGGGRWPYGLLVALSGLAVAAAAIRLAGRGAGLAVGLLWLVSPMVLSLSFTTHPQLLSRSFVALAVAAYLRAADPDAPPSAAAGSLLGLFTGLAFLCRPFEAAALLAPAAVHLTALALRERSRRPAWLAAALVWAASAALFGAYNHAVTGAWYRQARFGAPNADRVLHDLGARELVGVNLGFNVTMLGIWLIGPLVVAAVGLALGDRRAVLRALAAGVVLDLLLALLHKDTGIHTVGPIHYSEAAVPLLLLAGVGLRRAGDLAARFVIPRETLAALFAGYVASLALFDAVHALTLRDQARVQRVPFEAVERSGLHRALVVAEPPFRLWELRPELDAVRSWVVRFPPPDPFLRDDVLFVEPRVPLATLAARFPDRRIYAMTYHAESEPVRLAPVWPAPLREGG